MSSSFFCKIYERINLCQKKIMKQFSLIRICTFLFLLQSNYAQSLKIDDIQKTILTQDSLLFSVGFNHCNIPQYDKSLSENFRFYHDKDGISDKVKFMTDLKNGLCKNPEKRQVKRVLVKDHSQIFPLYQNKKLYGAVHNGEHQFYEKQESNPGVAKFSNVWILENNEWKLQNSTSFDHQAIDLTNSEKSILEEKKTIENWLKEYKIKTLGIGVIEKGKLSQINVFGDLKDSLKAPYNTIFNVASLTKPITAMVAMRLISLGKWGLDEPIYQYWIDPDISKDSRYKKLTTRFILSHQTGFPNWRWMTKNKTLEFEFEPGTQYQYSGEGFEYLRKALENKFKKPLEQLANELIFEPLKMNDTDYIWTKNTDESRFAIGYDEGLKPYKIIKNKTANAADDLHTTIEDYGNFLVNILNGRNLDENVYNEMLKKQVKIKENKYFGLGFSIYDLGNNKIAISHDGADFGTHCISVLLPDTKQGILLFTNSDVGYKIYEKILKLYLGKNGNKIVDIENN
mgnify:CR=1 FL=1